ncbi:hypothetical protein VII00023_15111 [Vibrio ichthyoenteri ATCC 700023]|uniref:Uncharacterized protein n=1 Tax=Vibrio ichthyoenteri ATCC 700023 TaxID=870968 RepID=F9S6V5_9VIBR|nr:DUF2057 domain-containing protein [Vibrio ichthyoenteri]EGU32236.1 hypothetical protein VII00023_15111 [Vibrio ichthyoenteri ATCC 700023]
MNAKGFIAFAATLLALPLHAAEITASRGVSILYINGQAAEQKIGINKVGEGFTQVVVQLDDKLGKGNVFTSKPYVINFDAQDKDYKITLPKFYSEMAAKEEFAKASPNWGLESNGSEVEFDQALLEGKKGFMPYGGMENLIAEHNKQRGIYFQNGQLIDAPVAVETAAVTSSVVKSSQPKATTVATKNVDQLKAWYLQASKEERKEFRRWMIDQE